MVERPTSNFISSASSFSCDDRKNAFQEVVSPDKSSNSDAIWINQDAWFCQGDFNAGYSGTYSIKRPGNGTYFFVIDGAVTIAGEHLGRRDGIGIEDADIGAQQAGGFIFRDLAYGPVRISPLVSA